MRHRDKTKSQLLAELAQLRARVAAMESLGTGHGTADDGSGARNTTCSGEGSPEPSRADAILHAAMECLPFDVFAIGCDGRYMLQNAVSRANYGDAIGRTLREVCRNERDLAVWLENHRRALAGERVEGEVAFTVRGEQRHYYNVIAPIRHHGTLHGIVGINVDITERKRAEAAWRKAQAELERRVADRTAELTASNELLRTEIVHRRRAEASLARSERRFRNYFEQGLIGMVVTALNKRWLEVNDRCCQILGYQREELLATTWADLTHPDDLAKDVAQFDRLLAGEISHYTLEKRFLRKDGQTVHAIIAVRLFRDEDGSFEHVVCLIQDVTEQKQAEEAVREERRTLKHLLRASDRERQLIAYDVHDGLAQHLAGAIMQFQAFAALQGSEPRQTETSLVTGVEMVRQALAEARRLIAGVRPPILDESGVIAAIDHLVQDPMTCPNQEVQWHPRVEVHRLAPIVENALYRMVQEALSNACRHSRSAVVQVSLVQKGTLLELTVEDRGIGFDPATVSENCFGLRSIRERARLLGGQFFVRSRPGRGTCLRVTLPISDGSNK